MKLTIFSRLLIGHLIIFTLVIGMSAYAIVQISRINEMTQSVLTVNNRMSDNAERLSDVVFSQVRYERKYLISKDEVFYNQFLQLKADFDRSLGEMMSLADSPQTKRILTTIKGSYQNYQFLFLEELKFLKAGRSYSREGFNREKEKATQSIIDELEKLRMNTARDATSKIRSLHQIGTRLRRIAVMMTGAFLIFGIVTSLLINRSITQPLSILEKRTKDIGKGNFKEDLTISSPPELAGLAASFNLMCNKLSELEKMKSDFFSSVTHELRTPLSTIKMGIVLLTEEVEGPLTEGQRGLLKVLEKETLLLIGQVNSLLDLSKMEAGMMRFQLESRNIGPLIDQTVEEMGPLVEAKKLNVEVMVTDGLPSLKIDSERILQALRNIIGNAVKFTPENGRVKVSARRADHGVEVSVADTGPGIPAGNLITIFEKFQQATTGGSHAVKGTGLGLAIAKQIITLHGGKIWAESEFGRGSTFIFVLPA
ncbi:MAG TPA: ATP-binding protein [Thermodesulfobacteriota bacterium]|nr:ATP-binding protein [Thermodesulfobacteriota bacterium]